MNMRPRPYFLPAELDLNEFSEPVQLALDAIILPAYEELVLAAPTGLERANGGTLVCLMFMELVHQFEMGSQLAQILQRGTGRSVLPNNEEIDRYLKLIAARDKATAHYMKLVKFCKEYPPLPVNSAPEDSDDTP